MDEESFDDLSVEELREQIEWDVDGLAHSSLDEEDDGDYLDRLTAQY